MIRLPKHREASLFCNLAHNSEIPLLDTYYVPGTLLNTSYFISLRVTAAPGDGHLPDLPFTGEESDAPREYQVTCPKSHSCKWQSWDFPPAPTSQPMLYTSNLFRLLNCVLEPGTTQSHCHL